MSHGLCLVLGPHRFVDLVSCNVLETLKVMAVTGHFFSSILQYVVPFILYLCVYLFIYFWIHV